MGIKVDKSISLVDRLQPVTDSNAVRINKLENLELKMEEQIKELFFKAELLSTNKVELLKHIDESNKVWQELHETRTIAETYRNHFARVENYIEKY